MKIRLFNVKYSPNLGDGLLSECLENALVELGASSAGTYSTDFGARTSYANGPSNRARVLQVLQATPPMVRQHAMRVLLGMLAKVKWEPHYRSNLNGADAVVIGGGNLFTDMDLNFPVKITSTLSLARSFDLPVAIYGVGVSSQWSETGLRMVQGALSRANVSYISVRDTASKENFDRLFGKSCGLPAKVVRDPGLMVSRYVKRRAYDGRSQAVGVCVTSAIALNYHSDISTTDADLTAWYMNLFRRLLSSGSRVVVFTNGSPEDNQFLSVLSEGLPGLAGRENLTVAKAETPTELAILISGLSSLIAHRMHALIAAFSFGVPIFALQWDTKVNAFMESVGLRDRIAVAGGETYTQVADEAVLGASVNTPDAVVDQAFSDAGELYAALNNAALPRKKTAA